MTTRKPSQKKDANSAVYLSRGLQEIILAEAVSPTPKERNPALACLPTASTPLQDPSTPVPTTLRESLAIIEQRQCTSVEFYLKAMWQRLQV